MPEVQRTGEGKLQRTWDPWKMFDVSTEELEMMKKRKAMAAARKAEFRMIKSNPAFIVNGGLGGHIVDPAVKRWEAARATYGDFFKVNRKNTSFLFLWYILPIVGVYKFTRWNNGKYEESCRKGEIPTNIRSRRVFLNMP